MHTLQAQQRAWFVRAAVVAVAVVVGSMSWSGATAVSLGPGRAPADVVLDRMSAIVNGADFQGLLAASSTGAPVSDAAVQRVTAAVNSLAASPEFEAVTAALAPKLASSDRDVNEFLYWVGQGNSALLSNVNLWAGVVVPGILDCQIGNPGCAVSWITFGAIITQVSIQSAAFSYLTAVLALP